MIRSHYWLTPIQERSGVFCTRCDGEMVATGIQGNGSLAKQQGTELWVCAKCEPKTDGKWQAEKENG